MSNTLAVRLAVSVPLGTLAVIWNGFVLSVMWGWFIVPSLHAPPLALAQAVGVSLVVGLFTFRFRDMEDAEDRTTERMAVLLVGHMLTTLIALGIGWVVTWFLP